MGKSFVSLCLLRIIYPICLIACVSCRQDLITAIFLLFLLYIPFVPVPTQHTMSGHTGFFLKFNFIISTVALCLQVVFQIFLLSFQEYGKLIGKNCGEMEKLFRHLGFIKYGDSLSPWNTALHIAPEVIAIFSSFFVYVFCDRLNPKRPDFETAEEGLLASLIRTPETTAEVRRSLMQKKALLALAIIGKYLSLVMLCFASILVPSFTSGFLYVTFLCCVTYWACDKNLGKNFAYLCRFLCVIIFFYIVAIFCYQTEWVQEQLSPSSDIPKNFGLQALLQTSCSNESDSRAYITNPDLSWPSFVLPYALIMLLYLLIYESGLLLFIAEYLRKQPEGMSRQIQSTRLSQKSQKASLFRNKTNRWRIATRQALNDYFLKKYYAMRTPSETTPLLRGRESVYRRSGTTTMSQDSHGSITLSNNLEVKVDKPLDETHEGDDSFKVEIMEYLIDASITVISFITRTSYIGTNIIMMTWSITYHSWLTFFLLLGAIILWMVPNQRQSMLRLSPFLTAYAIFLLVTQYLFDLNFINEEIIKARINISDEEGEQIGFSKSYFPVKELGVKTLFTTMFWITMRQYMRERQESKSTSTVAHMMAPVHFTFGTATALGGDPSSKGGQIIQKFGEEVRKFLTKFWIWAVTITLFAIGIVGEQMNLFKIIYMALALTFVITFQLSWVIWRKMMYGFWLTVIIISMIILVMIYTFQFVAIKSLWEQIGVDEQWQKNIGLDKKTSSDLFFFLIVPTFFVIITVIQLKYFHKDFLLISDIKSRGTSTARPKSRPSIISDEYSTQKEDISSRTELTSPDNPNLEMNKSHIEVQNYVLQPSRPSFHVFGHAPTVKTLQTIDKIKLFVKSSIEMMWLFMELHIKKIILTLIMVNVIHFGFVIGTVTAMMLSAQLQDIVIKLTSVTAAIILLAQMIFQIDHFTADQWSVTCMKANYSVKLNGTDWLGFYKVGNVSMLELLSGYIWIILAVTIYVVIITRQKYKRHLKGRPLSRNRVLFPRVSYREANNGVLPCIQYLLNYGFFRFGVEITFISIAILIATRLNLMALIYAIWLMTLIMCSRVTLSKVWYFFNWFVAVSIPLEYAICVGSPPSFCFVSFEVSKPFSNALLWLFMPVNNVKPDATLLIYDFIVLLLVTRQTKVFRIEYQHRNNDYPGGLNKSILHEMESPNYINPIPDFISDKKSYLDIIKHGVLCSLLWISCAVGFLAGTSNVTLFSFGYVIGSFLILWQGNDFYLRPISSILKLWNCFLTYNVGIILLKALFQIPGCILMESIPEDMCLLVKLLGIGCIKDFTFLSAFLVGAERSPDNCTPANIDKIAGMGSDVICFILLIFQKRLFSSHYFVRIVDEAKAMAVLAARGAELIEELSRKQIQKQQELEKAVLQKIKSKMDSIKAAQKKVQGIKSKENTTHAEEPQAPLAHETSPSISSAISHQGFHTPIEDDLPTITSRPNSYLQPPTPTSAIMTVSLEGYLEPQRMSFGSRPFSYDETGHPFSPPLYGSTGVSHRRQSSLGFYPLQHWYPSSMAPRRSSSVSSHHASIRSGDYYMFDDNEENNSLIEAEDELTAVEEVDEEYQGRTLGKLMESVMKNDLKRALKSSSEEMSAEEGKSSSSKSRSKMACKSASSIGDYENGDDDNACSTCQFKSTDATTSKDVTDSFDDSSQSTPLRYRKRSSDLRRTSLRRRREKEQNDDISESNATSVSVREESRPIQNCMDGFLMYLRVAKAFLNSCMISIIQFLNRKSRDHRYVIHALEKEKKTLKETRNLRIGMRILPNMKWQPVPADSRAQKPKSSLKIEDFESQGLVASSQPVFVRLLLAIYHALMSHSDMVCYFAVFILQIKSPTLASLPLSLMVLFWGTLSIPRPTKRFWVTIIAYTEFVVVVKNICQSDFFPIDTSVVDEKPFHWARTLGVERESNDAFYDLLLLLAVFFHRSTLKSLGLWKSAEEFNKDNKVTNLLNLNYVEPTDSSIISGCDSDVITEVTTVHLNISGHPSEEVVNQSMESYQNQSTGPQYMKMNSRSLSTSKENLSFTKPVTEFFSKLIDSKSRIADDVYAYMFFCDFCNIIVIIFGFSSFGAAKGDGGVTQYIEDNKIPFAFLAMVIIQFALIVVDRWLYLSRYIVGKLVFQYLLVVAIHVWMFFILPAVTERRFNDAYPPSIWYLIKCLYLLLSAYQIRCGYPTRILGNFLCKNYNLVNMVLFKVFMAIPFVYELRTLMDWIWTETSMTVFDWIKMEDIFSQIFQLKCSRRAECKYPLPRSQKIPAKTKFLWGAGGLVGLFTTIWFPLVLFSLGDTVGEPNIPTTMHAKVQISSYQPIYNSYSSKIYSLTGDQWREIKKVYQSDNALTFLSDYYSDDVGVLSLPTYSSSIWTIPPPERDEIIRGLTNCTNMKIAFEWTINRQSENPESPKTITESNVVPLSSEMCRDMLIVLQLQNGVKNFTIPQLMPKFLKVTSIGKATPVTKLMKDHDSKTSLDSGESEEDPHINMTFCLQKSNSSAEVWWLAYESKNESLSFLEQIDNITSNYSTKQSIIMYTFNDKTFPPGLLSLISGQGGWTTCSICPAAVHPPADIVWGSIIGLYTTFVIVAGAYIKGYFTNTSSRIMFEDMPYVDRILQLCLDIFLVRERREFDLEEDLFAKLLFLYRSPETIIKWTRPPEDGGSDEY